MPRYFIRLAYDGTDYSGWQRQPNAPTVQASIEDNLSILLQHKIIVIGCGRTDAGVHATQYYAHFDHRDQIDCKTILFKLNNMLGKDIVIYSLVEMPEQSHARFDATSRSYIYTVSRSKPLMDRKTVYRYFRYDQVDRDKINEAASAILKYSEFETFCKSNTQVKTKTCVISESKVIFDDDNQYLFYHISANRFLRGMVRLITGALINIGIGKVSIDELHHALSRETKLEIDWSVPARGLRLSEVKYPYVVTGE